MSNLASILSHRFCSFLRARTRHFTELGRLSIKSFLGFGAFSAGVWGSQPSDRPHRRSPDALSESPPCAPPSAITSSAAAAASRCCCCCPPLPGSAPPERWFCESAMFEEQRRGLGGSTETCTRAAPQRSCGCGKRQGADVGRGSRVAAPPFPLRALDWLRIIS